MTHRITIGLAILALSAIAFPSVANCEQKEPVFDGKPLSYWMERLDNLSDTAARAAIKEIGTNALPDLMRMLRQLQSAADQSDGRAVTRSISLGGGVTLHPSPDQSRVRPLYAVACLGPAGQPALPEIVPLLSNSNYQIKISAFFALQSIGPDTQTVSSVVPILFQALGDREWTMRLAALNAIAALRPRPPETTPTFIRFLDDPSEIVREEAMRWLVAQTNAIVLPRLDKQLHDKDSYVVVTAASQIGAFGPAAATSEPRLRQLLNDPLLTVRQSASNALATITGQPIFRSAPKENADLTFNMPGVPLQQILDIYGHLAGKKVTMTATSAPGQTLRVITAQPLTKSEALQLFDEVLKEQAGLVIVHGQDGSLTAIAKPRNG
ncbi:MAG TPA: HEAT repeat domain-containing protein [Verrucomicrobiae bacterium]|jgi:HEAT repeat protein|nr:HEAT repeat domain-containing protein [Verrucomicrobiae bacterium]